MDDYARRYPSRTAPEPPKNPLVDLAPAVISWVDLEAYFKECRERTILDMAQAQDDRALWQAQGKLALIVELTQLRAILHTLDSIGRE